MGKFMDWLAEEAKGKRAIMGYMMLAALFSVSLDFVVRAALINWGIVEVPPYQGEPVHPFKYYNFLVFANIFVLGPIQEELVFRFIPLASVLFFTKKPVFVIGAVVFFAALFGAIHPYTIVGNAKVAIAGFTFGIVFLKCGGMNSRFVKAALCSMFAHGMANVLILASEYYEYLERVL